MPLLDSGSGSDLFKDDGTYSGFFLDFASNGRYNVKINVIGYEVSEIRRRRRSTSAEVQTTDEPSFMRTASGGVFKVHSYTANPSDTIAPSRIQDLNSESFSYDNSTVTLVWTAVGDDMDQGTAYSYDLRYSTNFSEVRDDFNRSHLVSQEQVLYGNLSHVNASGTTESVTITLPQKGEDIVYYFGIRAWDEAGNGGDLSNIVSLSIRFIPVALPTAVMPTMHATDVMTEIITAVDKTESIATGTIKTSSEDIPTSSDTLITTSDIETPTSGLTTEFSHTFPGSQSTSIAETTDVMTEIITTLDKTESIAPGTIKTSSEDTPTSSDTQSSPSETTVSEEPEPLERTTQQEVPETTKATEPTGPEAQAVIIGLSCALSVVTIIAAVSLVMLMYIYYLKQTPTSVKPITPPKSAWVQQELADIEMVQKDPSYMRKILV
ncbi:uncharacterized protein LOC121412849 [Lytechinus variegatus]|uniref:uncharacterized protein LOC121412849 n=1 Tax=Lytechinus variegatus TaxID=7654 RepID=UPI001BB14A23|nr:uncharacterized protein LOC121412849 [Lytechinus variegatus]